MPDYIFVNSEYSQLLRREELVNLKRLLRWSEGELVGEHGPRRTWRVSLANDEAKPRTFYIRQEQKIPFSEILEDLTHFHRPASRGYKTLLAGELFAGGGIDVAPLCCLIERRFLDCPIRAVAIQGHAPGKDIYNQLLAFGRPDVRTDNPTARRKLLYELGDLLAKINHAGIYWPDLVGKHIFVEQTVSDQHCATAGLSSRVLKARSDKPTVAQGTEWLPFVDPTGAAQPFWRFMLIDIERAESGLNARKRDRQMKRFLYSLRGLLTVSDLMRMARGYLSLDMVHPKSVRRKLWQKYFPNGAQWLGQAREEMAAIKTLPENQPLPEEELYERIGQTVINMRFKPALRELGLLEKGALFAFQQGSELHKPGLGRRVRMRFETFLAGSRIWLYLKRVRRPKLSDQLDRILCGTVRHSGCWHERYMIKQLGLHRIPAPVVVAYSEKMFFGYERAGALVSQGIVGQSLEKFIPKHFSRPADEGELRRRRNWIRQAAGLIGRFHRGGFCHRDLYLSHIFIGFKKNGDPVFYLIDLARVFKMRFQKERWFIKDMAALNFSSPRKNISNTDRMRFFKKYLGENKLSKLDKIFARKIIRKTQRIARHYAKHPKITTERAV
ncbi:MAG: lipopolysaccharide kinase InaA family protein [Phycisphaerae bacterium]